MSAREFFDEYKSIILVILVAFVIIILFFICLGFSRSTGSSETSSSVSTSSSLTSASQDAAEAGDEQGEAGEAGETDENADTTEAVATQETAEDGTVFTVVNETVTTTTNLNFRTGPSSSYSIIETISSGTSLTRTGVSDSGWSRVEYNGTVGYVSSDYLTTAE